MPNFLDSVGLTYLWKKISLNDYPNNKTLISVINAIDETKANINNPTFSGEVSTTIEGTTQILATQDYITTILQNIYPVGALYLSTTNVNPTSIFGFGTWTQIKDTFLLTAGDSYAAGSTGGEATHKLTSSEMPSHTHTQLGTKGGTANNSYIRMEFQDDGNVVLYDSNSKALWNTKTNDAATGNKIYRPTSLNVDGITGSTGSDGAHNNMPPYLAIYVWQRTA